MRPPGPALRRLLTALLVTVPLAGFLVACSGAEDDARAALDEFVAGWTAGSVTGGEYIDPLRNPVQPAQVSEQLTALSGELAGQPPQLTVSALSVSEGLATATVAVAWPLPGGATWAYDTTVRLEDADGWKMIWTPEVVHPQLVAGDALLLRRAQAPRGDILDGAGEPLVTARDVVEVGIWPQEVEDLEAEVDTLEQALRRIDPGIDLADLPDRVREAEQGDFVSVIVLRQEDYDRIRDEIHPLPGTQFREYQLHLGPSSGFARALLGTVGPVTAEMIEQNPGVYEAGDSAGQGGLSGEYDELLRGVPGQSIRVQRDELELGRVEPVPGEDLLTTLDPRVQEAAEAAMGEESRPAALVAIRISDGAVLAVANTVGDEAAEVNTALTGAVAPGSTFKMVTAYRLLATGEVALDTAVECPEELTVEGFEIGNDFDGDRGRIPFREAVAISCNTAFAALAPRLGADGLAAGAAELGIGGDWDLGTETFTGSVGTGGSEFDHAQAAFGQGRTQVSPAAMAAATAAVARGAWLPPSLVVTGSGPAAEPVPLDGAVIADLQAAMRAVVTEGTASALADVPGPAIHGKTGSAEAGEEVTHGWFVGWQGDLALAVFVEDGGSGSGAAVPIAEDVFRGLG